MRSLRRPSVALLVGLFAAIPPGYAVESTFDAVSGWGTPDWDYLYDTQTSGAPNYRDLAYGPTFWGFPGWRDATCSEAYLNPGLAHVVAHPSSCGGWTTLAWVAPEGGLASITVSAQRDDLGGGDGVAIELVDFAGATLWSQNIGVGDASAYGTSVDVEVEADELIYLRVADRNNIAFDTTRLTFTVSLENDLDGDSVAQDQDLCPTEDASGSDPSGDGCVDQGASIPPPGSATDVFDIARGTTVLSNNFQYQGAWVLRTSGAGIEAANGPAFALDRTLGFESFIKFRTASPVALSGFTLLAGKDGGSLRRSMNRFALSADPGCDGTYELAVEDKQVPANYGLSGYRAPWDQVNGLQATVNLPSVVVSRCWELRVWQGNSETAFSGVRVIELDAIGGFDGDSDSVVDGSDNCPTVANTSQINTDADGLGDACDSDDDNDSDPDLSDCAPLDITRHAGAAEVVGDGIDQDCNGADSVVCYVDGDQDGFGSTATGAAADGDCTDAGEATNNTDCDDSAAGTHPGAGESCDGIDSDCDGSFVDSFTNTDGDSDPDCIDADDDGDGTSDGSDCAQLDASAWIYVTGYVDNDLDGVGRAPWANCVGASVPVPLVQTSGDCDDTNAQISPLLAEQCDLLDVDENCSDVADNAEANLSAVVGLGSFYTDEDNDSLGDPAQQLPLCDAQSPYITAAGGDLCPAQAGGSTDTNSDGCPDGPTVTGGSTSIGTDGAVTVSGTGGPGGVPTVVAFPPGTTFGENASVAITRESGATRLVVRGVSLPLGHKKTVTVTQAALPAPTRTPNKVLFTVNKARDPKVFAYYLNSTHSICVRDAELLDQPIATSVACGPGGGWTYGVKQTLAYDAFTVYGFRHELQVQPDGGTWTVGLGTGPDRIWSTSGKVHPYSYPAAVRITSSQYSTQPAGAVQVDLALAGFDPATTPVPHSKARYVSDIQWTIGNLSHTEVVLFDDSDADGLPDADEIAIHGTDPQNADADGDGLTDGVELALGTDPDDGSSFADPDSDSDGLDAESEAQYGTNPAIADTDGDGVSDGRELHDGTDPLDGLSSALVDADFDGTDDRFVDLDGDGLDAEAELANGSSDLLGDTDGDGIDDGRERAEGTDAADAQSSTFVDLDGNDVDDASADSDNDGVEDWQEQLQGTSATSSDSDGDGYSDGAEATAGTNPTNGSDYPTGDRDGDGTLDGLDNCGWLANDIQIDTDEDGLGDACDDDDDGDGVSDFEDAFPLDPDENLDSDGDGVGDGADQCIGDDSSGNSDGDSHCNGSDPCPTDAQDLDLDGDLVCDVTDVCVGQSNVDGDGDQICDELDLCLGNDFSGDSDADLRCDADDNCPNLANSGQADADTDGIGDVCEADSDADGTIDDLDNCLAVFNADQSDNEADGIGDACDLDDDNDMAADLTDNCPVLSNTNQADFDTDGLGDACDGDDDADGLSDGSDLCPATPLGVLYNNQGCSGAQWVARQVGSCTAYRNHGQYVSAVTAAANAARSSGLLTAIERAAIVRAAAQSSCR